MYNSVCCPWKCPCVLWQPVSFLEAMMSLFYSKTKLPWTCLFYSRMCCPWTCLVHSSLSCTWMCLVYSSLCCPWTFLFYSSLCCLWAFLFYSRLWCCPWMCLFHCGLCCPCTCLFTKDCMLSLEMSCLQQPVLYLSMAVCAVHDCVCSTAASAVHGRCLVYKQPKLHPEWWMQCFGYRFRPRHFVKLASKFPVKKIYKNALFTFLKLPKKGQVLGCFNCSKNVFLK